MRLKIAVRGAVQGVGFRPFVHRLATEMGLRGWVNNSPQGVLIEVEGLQPDLEAFLGRVRVEKPSRSFIQSLEATWLDPAGYTDFEIRPSAAGGARSAVVMPDIATCPDCLRELFDPSDRRHGYPFINCTCCGPRFSIIKALPYDRGSTTMKGFAMCSPCQAEYEDLANRRFHAQPNACAECGPHLEFWEPEQIKQGHALLMIRKPSAEQNQAALAAAVQALCAGKILALKGLGGFQLLVLAQDAAAVRRLRELKHRDEKPFALMFPSLTMIRQVCQVSAAEERLLNSPEAPIVLLRRSQADASGISDGVAPRNPNLGAMLPYSPLHHLLLRRIGVPVVATSGNLSDEPICIDERQAFERLGGIADVFLVHNRPIARHVDDSVVRVVLGRELVLRRARGYAPLPITLKWEGPGGPEPPSVPRVLALGAHLKNVIGLSVGHQVFLSQHIGDLETEPAYAAFQNVVADFQKLYDAPPEIVAMDSHPDYLSTRFAVEFAQQLGLKWVAVQHHLAHVLSCLAENELEPPALGVGWDGTGYGPDRTVWGGEFFLISETGCRRIAHLRRFRLPGGEHAVREPRRAALAVLYELFGEAGLERQDLPPVRSFSPRELATLRTLLVRGVNAPWTSSAGRLFDAVAALIGLRQTVRFEGQAAMELEYAAEKSDPNHAPDSDPKANPSLASAMGGAQPLTLDWAPIVHAVLADLHRGTAPGKIASRFHEEMAELIVKVAREASQERVLLSGGCFQNQRLTELAVGRLRAAGFRPYWHQRVPPNDGGIALGQAVAALHARFRLATDH